MQPFSWLLLTGCYDVFAGQVCCSAGRMSDFLQNAVLLVKFWCLSASVRRAYVLPVRAGRLHPFEMPSAAAATFASFLACFSAQLKFKASASRQYVHLCMTECTKQQLLSM